MKYHAAKLLQEKIEKDVRGALPGDGAVANFADALEKIRDVRKSEAVAALTVGFGGELGGICDFLQHISSGQPPQDKGVPRFLRLAKTVLMRAANFCRCEFTPAEHMSRGKTTEKVIYGIEVVQFRFIMLEDIKKEGGPIDVATHTPCEAAQVVVGGAPTVALAQ